MLTRGAGDADGIVGLLEGRDVGLRWFRSIGCYIELLEVGMKRHVLDLVLCLIAGVVGLGKR